MLPEDTIAEQTRRTEQVIAQVTGMPNPNQQHESKISATEKTRRSSMAASERMEGTASEYLARFISALKNEIRQEVLKELIPLMEAMERAAQGGNAGQQQAPQQRPVQQQQQAPPPPRQQNPQPIQDVQQKQAAAIEQRTQELQNMIEEKIAKRRQRIFSRM